jgi:hypothetical protein
VGNEENGKPVPEPKKTMINDHKETRNAHKNTLKEEILQETTENFVEKILHIVNKMYKMYSRNFKTPK